MGHVEEEGLSLGWIRVLVRWILGWLDLEWWDGKVSKEMADSYIQIEHEKRSQK